MKRSQRRVASMIVATISALVLTAQVALAGSGTGLIHFPNPAAPYAYGVTERSFRAEKCLRAPQGGNQGFDAWVTPLDSGTNFVVVKASELPNSSLGYTFHVVFYSYSLEADACQVHRAVVAQGNPTQALWSKGADWAVFSVLAGVEVEIEWKECSSNNCRI